MNNTLTEQTSLRNQDNTLFAMRSNSYVDQNQQNIKKIYQILDSQPSQHFQVEERIPESKGDSEMAELKDMGIISSGNDFEENQESCPFARIEMFRKQNFNRTAPLPYQNMEDYRDNGLDKRPQHSFYMQEDSISRRLDMTFCRESGYQDQIPQNITTPIKPNNLHYSFSNQTIVQQRYQMDLDIDINHQNDGFDKRQITSANIDEMAPNFIIKLQQSRSYQQNQIQNQSMFSSINHPINHITEHNNRVVIGNFSERGNSFITPIKQQHFNSHQMKMNTLTDVKPKNKVSIKNLANIRTSIMPIHIISNKKNKSKILDFQKQKPKKMQKSNIYEKSNTQIDQFQHLSLKNQGFFDDHEMMQENVDINRRVYKQKQKKKAFNKTAPSIAHQEAIVEALNTFKSTLSVQSYEIGYLNTLDDFNKKINDHKEQSLSLQGNYDQFQASLQNYNRQSRNTIEQSHSYQPVVNNQDQEDYKNENKVSLRSQSTQKTAQISNLQNTLNQTNQTQDKIRNKLFAKNLNQKQVTFQENSPNSSSQDVKYKEAGIFTTREGGNTYLQNQQYYNDLSHLQSHIQQDFLPTLKSLMYPPQFTQSTDYQNQIIAQSQVDKKVKCNCQKNSCTQGYCDCLKNGQACDPAYCSCQSCQNTIENQNLRLEIQDKKQKQGIVKDGGCNCKHSQCQKRYCECFQNGRPCDPYKCKCQDCKNNVPHSHQNQQQHQQIQQHNRNMLVSQLFSSKLIQ